MAFPSILQPEVAQVLNLNQQLESYESLQPVQQDEIQTQSLQALFLWAHTHSAFWRDRLDAAGWAPEADTRQILGRLPILKRADVQTHFDALVCTHSFPANSCVLAQTTGSTGQPVRVVKHEASYGLLYHAFALRCTLWHRLDVSKAILRNST